VSSSLPEPDFSIAVERDGGSGPTAVHVTGEIDMATADRLDAALRGELASAPVRLDLAAVTFMDSSGIRLLDALLRDCEREGWDLSIGAELAPAVVQVLELTGMLAVLPFARDGEAGGP
jgi:anti-sigma B factor antagonist